MPRAAPDSLTPGEAVEASASAATKINAPRARDVAKEAKKNLGPYADLPLTPGQLGGGREQLALEGMLRQRPGSRDIMAEGDITRLRLFEKRLNHQIEKIGPGLGDAEAVTRLGSTYNARVQEIYDTASAAARHAFERSASGAGGGSVLPYRNALAEVEAIADDYRGALGSDTADAIQSALRTRAQRLIDVAGGDPNKVRVTAKEMARDLSIYSKASRGSGVVVKDLDAPTNRAIAARMAAALERDLDSAIEELQQRQISGQFMSRAEAESIQRAAEDLRTGRALWRKAKEAVEAADERVLTRAAELVEAKRPEELVRNLARATDRGGTFSDREIGRAVAMIDESNPEVASALRRAVTERVLTDFGAPTGEWLVREGIGYDAGRVAKALGERRKVMAALFRGDPKGLKVIRHTEMAARMMADNAGIRPGQSQTEPMRLLGKLFESTGTIITNPKAAASEAVIVLRARRLARIANDPQARDIYMGLAERPMLLKTEAGIAALAKLKAIIERDEALNSAAPSEDEPQPAGYGNTIAAQ